QKFRDRFDKLKNIVEEAQKQSGNLVRPQLSNVESLDNLLDQMVNPLVLGVHGESTLIHQDTKEVTSVLIGPEGDFSQREYDQFLKRNFKLKKLSGSSILRTETAMIYLASLMKSID
ncbi:RsmE family RNA methyltransferase, partial [bacterium]|nr:RsmE family RNA methyltransferase [bacterium]